MNIKPAYTQKNIPIVFSSDDNYAPYLGVCIKSLIENASPYYNYDIIILNKSISSKYQFLIQNIATSPNVKIRFIDVTYWIEKYEKLFFIDRYFSAETYYRLFSEKIFNNYSKVLYIDVDTIILDDISKLYHENIDNYLVAATKNYSSFRIAHNNIFWRSEKFNNYLKDKLHIDNPYKYFQAGVLLLNINKLKAINFSQKAIKKLQEIKKPILVDQDIFNAVCYKKVKFINQSWNWEWINRIDKEYLVLDQYINEAQKAFSNLKIIHYDGKEKVWKNPHKDLAEYWWHYARQTPFYEEILYKNLKVNPVQNITQQITKVADMSIIREIKNYSKNRFNYYRCKLLANFTFGKMRKHYKDKKKRLKAKIKEVRRFLKGK